MEKIILENQALIYKIINKYKTYFDLEDLYQVAVIGLIKAYKNYKENYNTKFSTYAYPYIVGEVIKYINDSKLIKISNEYKLLYKKILNASSILTQRLMKIPSLQEISLYLEIDENLLAEVINANSKIDSLDRILSEENDNFDMYNIYGYTERSIENYPLIRELEKLSPEERNIIKSRYYENLSQSETGTKLGMYQMEVSRHEHKILKKIRTNIE